MADKQADKQDSTRDGTRDSKQPAQLDRTDDERPETAAERRRRRAQFLRELHEAKALRDRVQPRRARAARMRQAMRMRTFRW
ncbi:hypothetical protein [Streptomyces sp. NPDC023838]|uniref:hypothetical protein n=1 Tax=Streptomyces sp. NPDC023838 TaxID=3154325 RepID=UPI0034103543